MSLSSVDPLVYVALYRVYLYRQCVTRSPLLLFLFLFFCLKWKIYDFWYQFHDSRIFLFLYKWPLWCFCSSYIWTFVSLFFYPSYHSIVEKRKNSKDNSRKKERKNLYFWSLLLNRISHLVKSKRSLLILQVVPLCLTIFAQHQPPPSSLNLSFFVAPTSPTWQY